MKKLAWALVFAALYPFWTGPKAHAQINVWPATTTTGGGSTSVDGIDGASLQNTDFAIVGTEAGDFCAYTLDADASCSESSESPCPRYIQPDTNPGTKCWILTDQISDTARGRHVLVEKDADWAEVELKRTGTYASDDFIGVIQFLYGSDGLCAITANREGADDAAQLQFHCQPTGGIVTKFMVLSSTGMLSLGLGTGVNEFSTDETFAGDSDNAIPTEQAVKAYVDNNEDDDPEPGDVAWGDLVDDGSFTDEYLCGYEGTGTKIECDVDSSGWDKNAADDFDGTYASLSGKPANIDEDSTDDQPLEQTLTDIADGTIEENLVNTAYPWADGECTDALTIDGGVIKGRIFYGTLAARPATCSIGDIYWATDGDTDGELYVCRATNTWKAVDDDGGAGGSGDVEQVFDCPSGDCNQMTIGAGEWLVYGSGYIDANRFAGVTSVDGTEFGYLDGVTGGIQGQLDGQDQCSEITDCVPNAWDEDGDLGADEIGESKVGFSTVCGSTSKLYVSGNDLACNADDDDPEPGDVAWGDLVDDGSFTDEYLCGYEGTGTRIDCDKDPAVIVPANETDAAHDECSEIANCVSNAQAGDPDLTALAALSGTGLVARTGAATYAERTITGDSEIAVSNGNGVSGNPTLSLGAAVTRDAEWDTWAEHPALSDANILVGNGSNQPAAVNPSGDVDIANDGTMTVQPVVVSAFWPSGGFTTDGTQCADPAKATINSGPQLYSVICADNDGSTMYGNLTTPDSWNGGTVTFELSYVQTAADTSAMNADVACQCRGAGETVSSTWGTEQAIDDAAVSGSNAIDHTTSAAVTCAGTCSGGDALFWRVQLDATGTTTAVATLHFVGNKMEYSSNFGD